MRPNIKGWLRATLWLRCDGRRTSELLGGQYHVDSLLLQKDHDELRWFRRTRIAADRVHIVGSFIESLPWSEGDLLAAPHLHDDRTLQDVDKCVCVVTMDGVHRPRRIIDGDHQHLFAGYIGKLLEHQWCHSGWLRGLRRWDWL